MWGERGGGGECKGFWAGSGFQVLLFKLNKKLWFKKFYENMCLKYL